MTRFLNVTFKFSFSPLLDSFDITFACAPKMPGTKFLSDKLGTGRKRPKGYGA